MGGNVALEGLVGMIPLAGDVFDAAYKANQRNVRILDAWLEDPRRTVRSSRLLGAAIVTGAVLILVLLVALAIALLRWVAGLF
jgi:hypothetical protein